MSKAFMKRYNEGDGVYCPNICKTLEEIVQDIVGPDEYQHSELFVPVREINSKLRTSWADLVEHEMYGVPNHELSRSDFKLVKKTIKRWKLSKQG